MKERFRIIRLDNCIMQSNDKGVEAGKFAKWSSTFVCDIHMGFYQVYCCGNNTVLTSLKLPY